MIFVVYVSVVLLLFQNKIFYEESIFSKNVQLNLDSLKPTGYFHIMPLPLYSRCSSYLKTKRLLMAETSVPVRHQSKHYSQGLQSYPGSRYAEDKRQPLREKQSSKSKVRKKQCISTLVKNVLQPDLIEDAVSCFLRQRDANFKRGSYR